MVTLTPTTEDYLLAISSIETEGGEIIAARLAERLRVSPPSVSQTVDRMQRQDLVDVGPNHRIELTASGRRAADSIVRRHRLTERFLTDVLHIGWAEAHEEAHRLEHAISDNVEARLSELMNHPETCPHGSPIPGNFPEGEDRDWVALDTLTVGATATIKRLSELVEDEPELLNYCADKDLRPGVNIRLHEIGPDGLFVLDVGGQMVPVTARLGEQISCAIDETAPTSS